MDSRTLGPSLAQQPLPPLQQASVNPQPYDGRSPVEGVLQLQQKATVWRWPFGSWAQRGQQSPSPPGPGSSQHSDRLDQSSSRGRKSRDPLPHSPSQPSTQLCSASRGLGPESGPGSQCSFPTAPRGRRSSSVTCPSHTGASPSHDPCSNQVNNYGS